MTTNRILDVRLWSLLALGACAGRSLDAPSGSASSSTASGGSAAASSGSVSAYPIGGQFASGGALSTTPGGANSAGGAASGGSPGGLVVHEWGTYTSVHASDGHALGGVHHEDEKLPTWVYRRNFSNPQDYYFENLPEEPLEQLETPVLYFHSDVAVTVHVGVDFPEGVVGEWYPSTTSFAPAIGDLGAIGPGHAEWSVDLLPGADLSKLLPVQPDEIWAPSRNVAATPVRAVANGIPELEQFIFYRGLAKFTPRFGAFVGANGQLTIDNESDADIAAAFVLRVDASGGVFQTLGKLEKGVHMTLPVPAIDGSLDAYLEVARGELAKALHATGLYTDEAQAMVDTWTRSWFKGQGLRVLYIAPRAWTDAWLPTTISPTPSQTVRTLVGRVELLTPVDELALALEIENAASADAIDPSTLGRFAEPRLARAVEQITDSAAHARAAALLALAHQRP